MIFRVGREKHPEGGCGQNHGQAEDLPHGEDAPQKPNLRIWLAEKLYDKPENPIPAKKQTKQPSRLHPHIFHLPQNDKEDHTLKKGFVELGRMSRNLRECRMCH